MNISQEKTVTLSICIPLYNGGMHAYQNILHILKYPGNDIEIIISDNASTDGFTEKLLALDDCRLKIYRSQKDVGPYRNWYNALAYGTGKYLMLLLDRDDLLTQNLSDYLNFLRGIKYGVIINELFENSGRKFGDMQQLTDASRSIYWHSHPTYYVFLKEAFDTIIFSPKYYNLSHCSYPNLWWAIEIAINYNVFVNNSISICKFASNNFLKKHPSRTQPYARKADGPNSYLPKGQVYYCKQLILFLLHKKIPENKICEIILGIYPVILYGAVQGYSAYMNNPIMRKRYDIEFQKLDNKYFLQLNRVFYHYFIKSIQNYITLPAQIKHRLKLMSLKNALDAAKQLKSH